MRDLVKLINRKQQPGETFNGFYIALKQAAEDGGVNNCQQCHDRLIITLITSGICDAETKKKLLALRPFPELTSSRSAARKKPRKRTGMHSRALVQTRFPPTGADHVTGCSPTSRHLTGTEPPRLARGAETAATTRPRPQKRRQVPGQQPDLLQVQEATPLLHGLPLQWAQTGRQDGKVKQGPRPPRQR